MRPKLRIARATNELPRIAEMYRHGLGLKEIGSFQDHSGFDGMMVGSPDCPYHFEFTQEKGQVAPRSPSNELLLIFYYPQVAEFDEAKEKMRNANFNLVPSHNPYWDQKGCTFEDPEGYRIVLCNQEWR